MVIDSYKTGFAIPSDIAFEEISSSANCKTNSYPSMHGTGSSKKDKRRPGLFGILGGAKVSIKSFIELYFCGLYKATIVKIQMFCLHSCYDHHKVWDFQFCLTTCESSVNSAHYE